MSDNTEQPGGGAAPRDPWAPPDSRVELGKQDAAPPPPAVHDQQTVTSMPSAGPAPESTGPIPAGGGFGPPPSAVPPPPVGPGHQPPPPPTTGHYGYPAPPAQPYGGYPGYDAYGGQQPWGPPSWSSTTPTWRPPSRARSPDRCINTGQDCTAATRAYVQRPLYDAFVRDVAALMETVRLGDPFDAATDLGPLISHAQRDRVAAFVERARGYAQVVTGGEAPGGDLADGAYYRPTLVAGAAQDSEIVQSEIFGPVLVVLPFDTDDEGIALANDTPYGLAASAWTRDLYRANRATREIQAGCVWVNDHIPILSEMPHGGYKASGFGKDMSAYSFEEYTQVKHVMYDNTAVARKDWHRTIFGDR
ncbi:Gamma-aminobutyraldehyde dehydrogenase [Streptomyces cyaneofuscatus]